jgi:hypothetical protein
VGAGTAGDHAAVHSLPAARPRCRAHDHQDFRGFSAVAFRAGEATGGDGTRFDFETDVRAFQGTYVDGNGKRRSATFGFV